MANIRVDVDRSIKDGDEIKFRSPVDCSAVTGLVVYYPTTAEGDIASTVFAFADAHGQNVGDIDHLFAENVVVKVILDVTAGMAFVQNADTNAYIERTFVKTINGVTPDESGNVEVAGGGVSDDHINDKNNPHSVTAAQVGAAPAGYGLGEMSAINSTWNIMHRGGSGFFRGAMGSPDGSAWHGLILKQEGYIATEMAFKSDADTPFIAVRRHPEDVTESSKWRAWEYVNPPMVEGVEYRTTERWNGKPVYTKLIDGGLLADGKTIAYGLSAGEDRMNVIRISGVMVRIEPNDNDYNFIVTLPHGSIHLECDNTVQSIAVVNGSDSYTDNHVFVQIWYIK